MADDVQLTDLEVIQRYSLAVRGATASRAELVAALRADLQWLTGGSRASRRTDDGEADEPAAKRPAKRAPAKRAPAKRAPAKRAPAKRAAKG
jgi:hypothetical protein